MTQSRKIIHRTPKQVYTRWIAALRSGKYKQTDGYLHVQDKGFCCLGVLCDLAIKDGGGNGRGWQKPYSSAKAYNAIFPNEKSVYGYNTSVPAVISKYLGMTDEDSEKLIHLNDGRKKSFEYIADYIERSIMPKALARLKKQK